ncbi:cellulase [Pseudoxanthomonas suwonensis]|uniref:Cellulase n=1 Tax=Pseudoxanthomonas suwonensis TaxID=314722 RepID=A0A0E3Z3M6_9GAMM|nr:cellulase [Pseudoxanthomonas suwonensis]AKC87593.1 cellulase [Pseudoxanthomonas suwonensis]
MRRIALLLAVLTWHGGTASAASKAEPYVWRNVAIGGGGFVTGLVLHPSERGLAYARTDVGGAYRWDAAARRWIPLTDGLGHADANLTGIESVALDPLDPQRVYLAAGTYTHERAGNGAILRSADRGASFQRADLPFKLGGNELGRGNGERLAVDSNDGRVLLLGSRAHGLWRSEDYGARWKRVDGFPALATSESAAASNWRRQAIGIVAVAFDPASGRPGAPTPVVYAGVSSRDGGLFRSDDAGRTWNPVPGQPTGLRPNHLVRDARGDLLVSYGDEPGPDRMNDGAVWRFSPASGAWTDITPAPQSTDPSGDGFGWGAVAVDARDPDVIVATTFNRWTPGDDVYRSTDGGRSWTPVFARSEFDHAASPWTAQARPHWLADIEIDPHEPDRVLFVTGYGLWASRDMTALDRGGRVHWTFETAGLEETVPLDLVSPPQGALLVSGLGDIDGFRHDDLQRTTVQFAAPPRYSNTESLDYAGRQPQLLVRSGHLHHADPAVVRAAWSRDGGASWTAFATEPGDGKGAGRIAIAADGGRVIWHTREGSHWLTDDFGGRWQKVRGLPASAVVAADRVTPALWYGFDPVSGDLFVSGDGGVAFEQVDAGVGAIGDWFRGELLPAPDASGVVYFAASWKGLLRWGGGRLVRLGGVDNAYAAGLGAPKPGRDAPTLFVFGEVGGVTGLYRSDDDGKRWVRIDDPQHRFGSVRMLTGDARVPGRVYLATGGRGIVYGEPAP